MELGCKLFCTGLVEGNDDWPLIAQESEVGLHSCMG